MMDRWLKAQEGEREFHEGTVEGYRSCYEQYFAYLDTGFDQKGKTIMEIGPADFPALSYCTNVKKGYIIEPMPSDRLIALGFTVFAQPAEHLEFPKVDEIWLLNVLQHVIDPTVIVNKCKESAKIIRFFEPINAGTDVCHLHNFTLEDYKNYFGACVTHYPDHTGKVVNFHEHESAYGIWKK